MQYAREYRANYLATLRASVLFALLAIVAISLSGCEDERQKAWREWREEHDKLDYRCGMFGDYEFRINRDYLFFWPTYQGRSDWVVQGPPPWGCSGKLETVPIEAYWPGLGPAGHHSLEDTYDPDRIKINLEFVGQLDSWDFVMSLERRFGKNWKTSLAYQKNKDNLGLDYSIGRDWLFPEKIFNYYWLENHDGRISIFIICDLASSIHPTCTHYQYIPKIQVVLKIYYSNSKISQWKSIKNEVEKFIKVRSRRKWS